MYKMVEIEEKCSKAESIGSLTVLADKLIGKDRLLNTCTYVLSTENNCANTKRRKLMMTYPNNCDSQDERW